MGAVGVEVIVADDPEAVEAEAEVSDVEAQEVAA